MFDYRNFSASAAAIGADVSEASYQLLERLHSEPTRHYHGKSHIGECLKHFQTYRHLAERPAEIEVAFWFHDAVYDTHQNDNEERSARLAEQQLAGMHANPESIQRVVEMILATKTHRASGTDAALMVDIDLGILGTPPDVFDEYDRNIRREFAWVPIDIYIAGRKRVLQTFLDRETIFQTIDVRSALESQARANLVRKIDELDTKETAPK